MSFNVIINMVKFLLGVARPPRVGAVGPAGRVSPLLQTPPPRSPPPRGVCGGGVATPRARSTRPPGGGSPPARWPSCRVRVRVRPPPPPRPRCGVGRGRWEPPGRLWGCPRSPPAPARARRGRRPDAPSFVRPFRPCRSLISWSLLAGQRRPPGMCRAREGGSPLRSKLVRLLACLLYTSPSPRDATLSRMPSSA